MAIIGSLLKRGLQLRRLRIRPQASLEAQQARVLRRLIGRAAQTQFGQKYQFSRMLDQPSATAQELHQAFSRVVPTHDYNSIFSAWWHRTLDGEPDVCWPGVTQYFALSSGTSEAATKYIPVTAEMTRHIKRTGVRQILTLAQFDLPPSIYTRGVLMLGGSTQLNKVGYRYEGDLSGIQAKQIPSWFQPFYKPGRRIAAEQDWGHKLDEITRAAKDWDIGYIVGVPAWLQLLMEKIIAYYNVKTIHDIWPNLSVFTHGGVAFEPYKKGFEKLLAHPLVYLETYLASEGFISYQARKGAKGMKLVTDIGIYYEFVPFTETNFSADGELLPRAQALHIGQVQEGIDYALLLTTCAGTWRYLIGDTVRFVDLDRGEIVITGRTKHYISLCGEHLSVDNMNQAIQNVATLNHTTVREFAVTGVAEAAEGTGPASEQGLFAHEWYIGVDADPATLDAEAFIRQVDEQLKVLNDDYRTERLHALKNVRGRLLPIHLFYDFMHERGKEGGQAKFPRVLKKAILEEWKAYLDAKGV